MPKLKDINAAFRDAVRRDAKSHQVLRTEDFIRELRAVNGHFSENRLWMLRNIARIF